MDRVTDSLEIIRSVMKRHAGQSVVLWSGGKDSTVLLHLARQLNPGIPAVCYQEPWFPQKNLFVAKVAARWNITLYSPDPVLQAVYQQPGDERIALVSRHHIGGQKGLDMPKDVIPYRGSMKDGEWICSFLHHLGRPTGNFNWPWPVAFIGHKNGDVDPILGNIPLTQDYFETDGKAADFSFPLREWSDDDIWDYIEHHRLPYDKGKYQNRAPKDDKSRNTDYVQACTRCVDLTEGESVFCPLFQKKVANISGKVPRVESLVHSYFQPEHEEVTDAI